MAGWEYCRLRTETFPQGGSKRVKASITHYSAAGEETRQVEESGDAQDDHDQVAKAIAHLGADGWELVTVESGYGIVGTAAFRLYYYKRPLDG